MIWALLGFGVFVVIVLSWNVAHLSVTISKITQSAQASTLSIIDRTQRDRQADRVILKGLVDRLMSQNWESVRLHEGASTTPDGAFISPSDQKKETESAQAAFVDQIRPKWGHTSALADFFERAPDEGEQLAAEDQLDLLPEERMP
jgi:hypothetical protein